MIQQGESGLDAGTYTDFVGEYGDPILNFILEGYSLQLSAISDPAVGTPSEVSTVDAIVCDDVIVRCWGESGQIKVGTLASEDSSDQNWTQAILTATGINATPTIATDNVDTLRIFWYDNATIKYFESTDKGSSWGSAQSVANVSSLKHMAATSLTRVHYMALTSRNNCRLGVAEYSASWSTTNGAVYWPFEPKSFDAITGNQLDDGAASSNDIIAFSTNLPPLIAHRVDGTVLVKTLERVNGIVLFRYQNGRYSDHVEFDVIDNVSVNPARDKVRLSKYGEWIFMTYRRNDGSANYPHASQAISRSKTGLHWEQPYLIDDAVAGVGAILLKRGNHCYLVDSTGRKVRSPSVGYVGEAHSSVTHDLTDNVITIDGRMGDIKEVQATLASPEGVLDSILDTDTLWQMRISQGWVIDGVERTVQTMLMDLESISRSRTLPTDHRILLGRDALARMTTVRADYVQEWESQQLGGDQFQSLDGTKYSGLRHTAGYAGHWEAHDSVLELRSGSEPGVGFNIQVADVWGGSAQAAIKVAATDTDDFAGLIFRGWNKYNFWHVVYDAENDCLELNERKDNVDLHDPALAGLNNMGWTTDTWYYIKVKFRYNYVRVYYSTSGQTWVSAFAVELPGVPQGTALTFDNIPIMRGHCGYYGHGYSEYSPSYPVVPWTPPPIDLPIPVDVIYTKVWVGTREKGVYRTANFSDTDGPMPTWTAYNTGLPVDLEIYQICLDRKNPADERVFAVTTTDRDLYRTEELGSWSVVLDVAAAVSECGSDGHASAKIMWSAVDEVTGRVWVAFYDYYSSLPQMFALYSDSNGDTGTWNAIQLTFASDFVADTATTIWAYNGYIALNIYRLDSPKSMNFYLSTNNGVGWNNYAYHVSALTSYDSSLSINPLNPTTAYVNYWNSGVDYDLYKTTLSAASVIDASENLWPYSDAFYFDRLNANNMKMVTRGSPASTVFSKLTETTDAFATDPPNTNLPYYNIHMMADLVHKTLSNYLLYGAFDCDYGGDYVTQHHILIASTSSPTSLVGRAGNNVNGAGFAGSIPYDAGGVCREGIQVVPT